MLSVEYWGAKNPQSSVRKPCQIQSFRNLYDFSKTEFNDVSFESFLFEQGCSTVQLTVLVVEEAV